jgi:hypothetical protein
VDRIHQPEPGPLGGWGEDRVRPAAVRNNRFELGPAIQSRQPTTGSEDRPRPTQAHFTQVVNSNTCSEQFVSQSAREAQSEVWLHVRSQVTAPGQGQQVRLNASEEVTGIQV